MGTEYQIAAGTRLLQHTLRSICMESHWVYAVFWRIVPRYYPPPKWDTEMANLNQYKPCARNWMLVWEDGFCDFSVTASTSVGSTTQYINHGLQPATFFKMSHEIYNFGEGVIGKVAADHGHKWIYREPVQPEMNFVNNSLNPHPRTWDAQFRSGIQTIALVAVREGLLQLGSTKMVMEDLQYVIFIQRKFNCFQSIPGVLPPREPSQELFSDITFAGAGSKDSWTTQHDGDKNCFLI